MENTAVINGGGMFNFGFNNSTLTNCTFSGNTTGSNGGGMYNDKFSDPTLTNCTFIGNDASHGGGMYNLFSSNLTLTNCTFNGNTTDSDGGGMFISGEGTLTNCMFTGNTAGSDGGGMNIGGNAMLTNCTFSGNTASSEGGGIYNRNAPGPSNPTVTNTILWFNSDSSGMVSSSQVFDGLNSNTSLNFSNVQGGWTGSGGNNIDADPLFVDADGADNTIGTLDDDVRLSAGSPCIDAGIGVAGILTDLDGNARLVDDPATADTGLGTPPVDMGAYEFGSGPPTVRADFDDDGDVDGVDFAKFAQCFNKAGNPPRTLGCP